MSDTTRYRATPHSGRHHDHTRHDLRRAVRGDDRQAVLSAHPCVGPPPAGRTGNTGGSPASGTRATAPSAVRARRGGSRGGFFARFPVPSGTAIGGSIRYRSAGCRFRPGPRASSQVRKDRSPCSRERTTAVHSSVPPSLPARSAAPGRGRLRSRLPISHRREGQHVILRSDRSDLPYLCTEERPLQADRLRIRLDRRSGLVRRCRLPAVLRHSPSIP